MKKINTKNILKKIFKTKTDNKVKKKVSKKKVVKAKKIKKTKKIISKKTKKIVKKILYLPDPRNKFHILWKKYHKLNNGLITFSIHKKKKYKLIYR